MLQSLTKKYPNRLQLFGKSNNQPAATAAGNVIRSTKKKKKKYKTKVESRRRHFGHSGSIRSDERRDWPTGKRQKPNGGRRTIKRRRRIKAQSKKQ